MLSAKTTSLQCCRPMQSSTQGSSMKRPFGPSSRSAPKESHLPQSGPKGHRRGVKKDLLDWTYSCWCGLCRPYSCNPDPNHVLRNLLGHYRKTIISSLRAFAAVPHWAWGFGTPATTTQGCTIRFRYNQVWG